MKNLFVQMDSLIEKRQFMESNADEVLKGYEYSRELSEEELTAELESFSDISIRVQQIEEEKSRVMTEINARLKVEKALAEKSLALIRTKRIDVVDTVYLIRDEMEQKIGTYDIDGNLLSERTMRPTERQRTIFSKINES